MWHSLENFLLAGESWSFLGEVVVRSALSFLLALIALKSTGKRGVRQLTLFELVIILTMGSAAGDVAFYNDVGLLPVILTLVTIILVYRLATYLVLKSPFVERLVEGVPVIILENGLLTDFFQSEDISSDEFFMEMRLKSIEHLGQVRKAILEVNGDVSVFKESEGDVRPGLSIFPDKLLKKYNTIPFQGLFSCSRCGYTAGYSAGVSFFCKNCSGKECSEGSDRYCDSEKRR